MATGEGTGNVDKDAKVKEMTEPKRSKDEKMFTLKKWNAVAMWSWDVECDTCAICRVQVMGQFTTLLKHFVVWFIASRFSDYPCKICKLG